MATMNIAGLTPVNDPAYRYKMPRLTCKVEGRGNGIKTVLTNVKEVSESLKRDSQEITKFFGCELGAQTSYGENDRAIVNGSHRETDLQNFLSRYIEFFVLCKNCHLPETHYKIKDGMISQKCLACGNKDVVDMTHKLTTFILAQHKKLKDAEKKLKKKEGKDGKESSSSKEKKEKSKDKESHDDGDEKKEKKSKKEKKEKKEKESSEANNENGDDNSEDVEEDDSKAAGKSFLPSITQP